MSERPTPITDAYIGDFNDDDMTEGEIAMCEFARNLERQLAETRDEINEWKTLQGWGGTPEIINAFVKGQQSRIHAAQDIERQLADALAQLRIADEQLALERGALAEALEILDAFEYEPDEDSCMGMSFFKARLCEDSFFHLKWKLEEALKSPANTRNHPPQVG